MMFVPGRRFAWCVSALCHSWLDQGWGQIQTRPVRVLSSRNCVICTERCRGSVWLVSWISSVQFSCSVVSNSLQPHGLQHTRPPCPSPTPRIYPNSCPLSQWWHPTISSSVIPFSHLQSFPPPNEYSGLISFRMDWLNLLAVQETPKSLL